MSRTEMHIGKLTRVADPENKSADNVMLEILTAAGFTTMPDYYKNNISKWFRDEMYQQYIEHKGTVYKIHNEELEDDADIIEAKLEPDETISYRLKYYNGGASFNECLEEALNKL